MISCAKSVLRKVFLFTLILTVMSIFVAYSFAAGDNLQLTGSDSQMNAGNGPLQVNAVQGNAGAANPLTAAQGAAIPNSNFLANQNGGAANGGNSALPFGLGALGGLGAYALRKGAGNGNGANAGANPLLGGLGSLGSQGMGSGGSTNPLGNSALGFNTLFTALNGGSSMNKNPNSNVSKPGNYFVASNGNALTNEEMKKQAS